MNTLRKYVISAFAAIVLSLTLANVTAMACEDDYQEEYTCIYERQDECYCYFTCYCHVPQDECDLALFRNGYSKVMETE